MTDQPKLPFVEVVGLHHSIRTPLISGISVAVNEFVLRLQREGATGITVQRLMPSGPEFVVGYRHHEPIYLGAPSKQKGGAS